MKTPRQPQLTILLLLLQSIWLNAACQRHNAHDTHESILTRLRRQKSKPVDPKQFKRIPPLKTRQMTLIRWTSPSRVFYTPKRTKHLKRFPCKACHQAPIRKPSQAKFNATHGNIKLKHGSPGVLRCNTCHEPKDMTLLKLPAGGHVSFDKSFLLCASCHTTRARDWAGGAHGKRLRNWAGTRAIQTCTGCHNPHSPLFGKRWPKTYFRAPQKR